MGFMSPYTIWVRLMCALRAHIKLSNFRNILSEIEKTVNTFSILKKIFLNIGDVGPESWSPGPLHIKGPKPRPRSPIFRDTQ